MVSALADDHNLLSSILNWGRMFFSDQLTPQKMDTPCFPGKINTRTSGDLTVSQCRGLEM